MSAINQFKIVSLGVTLDTYDDIDISLTYQIDDIEDITVKKSSFSKTIILPGTSTNNQYFKNIFDVNIDISETSYNPKKALPVQVLIGDELIFAGNLQLLNIITNQKQVDYEIVITGIFKNIMIAFSDYYLNQLNLDEYKHFRSVTTISSSWYNNIFVNDPYNTTYSPPGFGYIYPITVSGQNPIISNGLKKFNSFDLNPAVYVRTIIDKMFEFAGYTYTSNFFESEYFNSLVVPTETPQYNTEDIDNKTVRVTYQKDAFLMSPKLNNGLQSYYSPVSTLNNTSALTPMLAKSSSYWSNATNGSWYFPLNVETGVFDNQQMQDPGNEWVYQNNGVSRYTCQTAGFYSIDLDNQFYMFYKHELGSSFKYLSGSIKYVARIYKVATNGSLTILGQTSVLSITPPTAGATGIFSGALYTVPSTGYMASGFLCTSQPYVANINIPSVWLNAGEQVRVNFQMLYDGNVQWASNVDKILVGAVGARTINGAVNRLEIKPAVTTNYGVNSLLDLAKMLPQMKMRDFFINIIKMFNLMVTDNPNVQNDLIIEPRDDFFDSKRKVNDWTLKLDYDQDIKQTPMSELDTKTYNFTYNEDDDYYNNLYEQQSSRVFGDYKVDFLNDFSVESKEMKLDFSPTPVSDNIISPLVAPFFCDIDTNNSLDPIKVKARILFVKRLTLNNQFYVITDNPNQAGNTFGVYAYAGMYDDPFDPEYSLEFGNSNVLYYNTSFCCPNNTLVNQSDFDLNNGRMAKYGAWNNFPFTRLLYEMGNRIPPIMQWNAQKTSLYSVFSSISVGNGSGVGPDSTDPQISTGASTTYSSMTNFLGPNFTDFGGAEPIINYYGLGSFANVSSNSTSAANTGISSGFGLTTEHLGTFSGLQSTGRAGAWIGAPMDEAAAFFNRTSSSGADSGFGLGVAGGNSPRTSTSGIISWALGNSVANFLPAYVWLSVD
jgi:hypothetical protein